MKTTYLSQPNTQVPAGMADTGLPAAGTGNQPHHHPTPTEYIIEALGEGIKQNFMGYNIDVEFLAVTARSIAAASANSIKQHIIKPIAARIHRDNRRPSYT